MSEEEVNKIWLEKYIKNNPFDFKQGIINHCRQLDKLDVYDWVAEDELKIQNLQQENQQLKDRINQYENPEDLTLFYMWLDTKAKDKMKELEQENQKLTHIIEELEKWLEEEKVECNNYSKYIEKKIGELGARSSGKTYIASEIMKNKVAKKNWQEVLDKLKQLKEECNGTR